jgi:hypothetical protein
LDQAIASYDEVINRDQKLATAYNRRGLAFPLKAISTKRLPISARRWRSIPQLRTYSSTGRKPIVENMISTALGKISKPRWRLTRSSPKRKMRSMGEQACRRERRASNLRIQSCKLTLAVRSAFAGMLLSIVLGPLVVREWWQIHYEKAAFWAGLTLIGLSAVAGPSAAAEDFVHSMALEYLPFILMLFALYTAAGGISIEGKLKGTPVINTTILGLGTLTVSSGQLAPR